MFQDIDVGVSNMYGITQPTMLQKVLGPIVMFN